MLQLFRKHTIAESGIFKGMIDWHSHILPGVDDGFSTMDESLEALEMYAMLGVREVWLTPHIMEDVPNTTETLRQKFEELKSSYSGPVVLHLAAEYMLDSLFEDRLEKGDLLPIGKDGKHILVETSYYNPPVNFYQLISCIKSKGYFPVLAHPERYTYMNMQHYSYMSDQGIKLQLNLFSLVGRYGAEAMKKARKLLSNRFYTIVGTDLHSHSQMETITWSRLKGSSSKYLISCFQNNSDTI